MRLRLQLLTLALSTKQLLSTRRSRVALPAVSRDVLEKFYPLLADYIIEARPTPAAPTACIPFATSACAQPQAQRWLKACTHTA